MTSLLFAIGTVTVMCGLMCLYCLLFEREPYDGQPQWRDE